MKYVLSLLVGLVAGTAVAGALVYFNPLTRGGSANDGGADWVLGYALDNADTWLSTHDNRLELPVVPGDVALLFEAGIRGSMLAAMPLRNAAGDVAAAATRISVPSGDSELLRSGLIVVDYWLVSVPGEGTIFVHAVNNQWPLLRDTVVRVDWLQRAWTGPAEYGPTRGPERGRAAVLGLTGRYAGARGHARERLSLDSYDGSLAQLAGELVLDVGGTEL